MRIDEIRNAYFAQKTKWNANCDFSIEQDKFVIRSATMNYSHEEVENAEYAVFKAGVACQQERIDKLEVELVENKEKLFEAKRLLKQWLYQQPTSGIKLVKKFLRGSK